MRVTPALRTRFCRSMLTSVADTGYGRPSRTDDHSPYRALNCGAPGPSREVDPSANYLETHGTPVLTLGWDKRLFETPADRVEHRFSSRSILDRSQMQ